MSAIIDQYPYYPHLVIYMNVLPVIYYSIVSKNILTKRQHSFIRSKSTNYVTIEHMKFRYSNIDQDNLGFYLFLNFKKAFDCVDHDIILSKLEFYRIRGLQRTRLVQVIFIKSKPVCLNQRNQSANPPSVSWCNTGQCNCFFFLNFC